jgi:hypothetical protein
MGLQASDIQVHLLGQAEALAANLDEVAIGDETLEVTPECGALLLRNLECLQQFARTAGWWTFSRICRRISSRESMWSG